MQTIFFDASTLILLAKIGLLKRFLAAWKADAVVTPIVAKEAWGQKTSPDAAELSRLAEGEQLRVQPVHDERSWHTLAADFSLGAGEAETIWAASRQPNALVATDDRLAIRACRALGVPWTSALSIVVVMSERQLLTRDLAHGFLKALSVHGRYSRSVIDDAVRRVGEGSAS